MIRLLTICLLLFTFTWLTAQAPATEFLFPEDNSAADAIQLHRRRGEQAMADGLYSNAVGYFRQYCLAAGATEPHASMARARLGNALLASDAPAEAATILQEWLNGQGAKAAPAERDMLNLFLAEALLRTNRPEDAMKLLPDLASRPVTSPVRFPAMRLLADTLMRSKEWSRIIELLEPCLQDYDAKDPRRNELLLTLGQVQLAAKHFDQSISLLGQLGPGLREDQELTKQLLLVRCYSGKGDTAKALELFKAIQGRCPVAPAPSWWAAVWPLAQSCGADAKLHTEAIQLCNLASQTASTDSDRLHAGMLLVKILVQQKQSAQARTALLSLIEKYPDAPERSQLTMQLAELKQAAYERQGAAELFLSVAQDAKQVKALRYRAAMQAADCLTQDGAIEEAAAIYRLASTLGDTPEKSATALLLAAEKKAKAALAKPELTAEAAKIYLEVADKYGAQIPAARESRLEAGRLLAAADQAAEALKQFQLFCSANPKSPRIWEAKLAAGITQKQLAKDNKDSLGAVLTSLYELASQCPVEVISSQAYLEAAQVALTLEDQPRAVTILNEFTSRFPDNESARIALHRAIVLSFQLNRNEEAVNLGRQFLQRYPRLPESAEVALLIGDQLRLEGKYSAAQSFYAFIKLPTFTGPLVPLAAFEVAECLRKQSKYAEAKEALVPLLTPDNPLHADRQLQARSQMLFGDILSAEMKTADARQAYAAARNLAGDTVLGYAALARQAEMYISDAATTPDSWKNALSCLQAISAASIKLPVDLRQRATYLRAQCAENTGDAATAINLYNELRVEYEADRSEKIPSSSKYYALAVWDVTRLWELKGDIDSLRLALDAYESFAATALPRASDAKARAEAIRKKHHLPKAK